jgi:hypothetical protein
MTAFEVLIEAVDANRWSDFRREPVWFYFDRMIGAWLKDGAMRRGRDMGVGFFYEKAVRRGRDGSFRRRGSGFEESSSARARKIRVALRSRSSALSGVS